MAVLSWVSLPVRYCNSLFLSAFPIFLWNRNAIIINDAVWISAKPRFQWELMASIHANVVPYLSFNHFQVTLLTSTFHLICTLLLHFINPKIKKFNFEVSEVTNYTTHFYFSYSSYLHYVWNGANLICVIQWLKLESSYNRHHHHRALLVLVLCNMELVWAIIEGRFLA